MSTFLELVVDLQREVGVQGAEISTVLNQTNIYKKLVNWIADADMHIQNMRSDWKFLWSEYAVSTSIGGATPTVPADLNLWDRDSFYLNYSLATNRRLKYVDYYTWKHGVGRGVQTNRKPHSITIKPNNQIVLINPPNAIYALTGEYWKTPTKMTANDDVSDIPAAHHRTIVVQAKEWYAEEQEMPDLFKIAHMELHGDERIGDIGLLGRLKAQELPGNEGRTMGKAQPITIRPE